MPFVAHVLKIFIASPGDTSAYRDAVERALHRWNSERSEAAGFVLLPRRWEADGIPMMGSDGQAQVNEQLVNDADVVIGIFYTRVGRPTVRSRSGTAEEIEQTSDAGKPVHVYFSAAPLPADVDPEQLVELREFRDEMQGRGLTGTFITDEDLQHQVRAAIEFDLAKLDLRRPTGVVSAEPHASLRVTYASSREATTDNRGRLSQRTRRQRLVVTNVGQATANTVSISIEPMTLGDPPLMAGEPANPDILPNSSFDFPLIMHANVSEVCKVTMAWTEDDDSDHRVEQTVRLAD